MLDKYIQKKYNVLENEGVPMAKKPIQYVKWPRCDLNYIPKSEKYIQYMIEVIMKLPRTEKYSIGTEYKQSMYRMLEIILYIEKTNDNEKLLLINKVDSELNVQRIFLRIMVKNCWIDKKKFSIKFLY